MARGTWQGGGTWQTTSGGGGLVLAVIVALVVIGAAVRAAWHAIVTALEITAYAICATTALAAIGGIVYTVVRLRARAVSSRRQRIIPARAEVIRLGAVPEREGIEPPRPRPAAWPLPGQWEEIRGRIGRDD